MLEEHLVVVAQQILLEETILAIMQFMAIIQILLKLLQKRFMREEDL